MTESVVERRFCQPDTSSKKCAMYFEVIKFCSWTWLSSSVSTNSSELRNRQVPVRPCWSCSNSMIAQVASSSFNIFSMPISLTDLSTISRTVSSWSCKFNLSKSLRLVLSVISNLTPVAFINWCQWRSRMDGFWSSATTRNEVNMFFTCVSSPQKTSHPRASLLMVRISLAKRFASFSMFSTLISAHRVFVHSSMDVQTSMFRSQTSLTRRTSLREAFICLNSWTLTSNICAVSRMLCS